MNFLLRLSVLIGMASTLLSNFSVAANLVPNLELIPISEEFTSEFGRSVGIDGNVAIVGAPGEDAVRFDSGAAYLFDSFSGQQFYRLVPDDPSFDDEFGTSVAVAGEVALVGSPLDDDNGTDSGSAYFFDVVSGSQTLKISPNDGEEGDRFGAAVALDNGLALIGASSERTDRSGTSYLFDVNTGAQLLELSPPDGGNADNFFGNAVALDGGIAVVGAFGDDDKGGLSGAAYVFDAENGDLLHKLMPSSQFSSGHRFGLSVSISNGLIIVGSTGFQVDFMPSGAAFVYDALSGELLAELISDDISSGDLFGSSVGIQNGIALVGAPGDDDNGSASGSAYLFDARSRDQLAKINPADGDASALFGDAVGLDGSRAVIGSPRVREVAFVLVVPEPAASALISTLIAFWGLSRGHRS